MPNEATVDHVVSDYVGRRLQGEAADVEGYLLAHPEHSQELIEQFATADMLWQLAARDERVPTRREIGDYRLLRKIGRGGMGSVFLAQHNRSGRTVALKLLGGADALSPSRVRMFHREANVAARLRHPNMTTVYETGEVDSCAFIAMQYIDGISAGQLLGKIRAEHGRVGDDLSVRALIDQAMAAPGGDDHPEDDVPWATPATRGYFASVARVISEVADAVHFLNLNKVFHRDIKPQNILLDHRGTPFLCDFGLATDPEGTRTTQTGDRLGTLHYMSPELLRGGPANARSDVYSLGVTLFELLTLQLPHPGSSADAILQHIQRYPAPDPVGVVPQLPPALRAIVRRAIAADPKKRYRHAGELAEELRRFLRHAPIIATLPTAWGQWLELARRHAIGFGIGAVLALALSSWAYMHYSAREERWHQLSADGLELLDRGEPMRAGILLAQAIDIKSTPELHAALSRASGGAWLHVHSAPGDRVWLRKQTEDGDLVNAGLLDEVPESGELRAVAPPGDYLVVVERPGFGFAEIATDLTADQPFVSIEGHITPNATAYKDMRLVSGGTYRIGLERTGARTLTLMPREVTVAPFWIDTYEVSNVEYQEFVRATNRVPPAGWNGDAFPAGADYLPVCGVSWQDAVDYAEWAGKRLLTEIEWEVAARGQESRLYPWGNTFDLSYANVGPGGPGNRSDRSERPLVPVHQAFGRDSSWLGVLHMAGNVTEWTLDRWRVPRDYAPQAHRGGTRTIDGFRVARGGSAGGRFGPTAHSANRIASLAISQNVGGIRCGKSAERAWQ